jgi:hypothetical protein
VFVLMFPERIVLNAKISKFWESGQSFNHSDDIKGRFKVNAIRSQIEVNQIGSLLRICVLDVAYQISHQIQLVQLCATCQRWPLCHFVE